MEILTWAQRKTITQTQFVSVVSKVISDGIFNERFIKKISPMGDWRSTSLEWRFSILDRCIESDIPSSSSRMRVIYHNWSAMKQRPHPQSVAEISHHSVLSGDRIRQCETSSGTAPKLLNGSSFNDLEWPLSQISRSRYYSTSNNSKTVQDRAIFTMVDQ